MTRQEFDHSFAATMNSTEGFAQDELDEINNTVFSQVCDLDYEGRDTEWQVANAFKVAFDAY